MAAILCKLKSKSPKILFIHKVYLNMDGSPSVYYIKKIPLYIKPYCDSSDL